MSTPRPRSRWAVVAAAAVLVALTGGVAVAVAVALAPAATIGGRDVSDDEYASYAQLAQAAGDRAEEPPRATVLALVAHDQALLDLAREAGLADVPATPADLLAAREQVNRDHADAQRSGDLVYGSGDYGVVEFHSRATAQLRATTIQALREDPRLQVTDAQVAAEYAAHPGDWSLAGTTYHFSTYTVPGAVGADSGAAVLQHAAASRVDAASAPSVLPQAVVGSADVSGADLRSSGLSPDALTAIPALATGDYLPPQPDQGSFVLYRLESVTRDDAAALQTYRSQIRQVLVERAFDALLEATARQLLDDQN